jgi:hypothetical protein
LVSAGEGKRKKRRVKNDNISSYRKKKKRYLEKEVKVGRF